MRWTLPRRSRAAIAGVVLASGLAGCSPSPADFRHDAERFLHSDVVWERFGLDLPAPTCEQPGQIEVGATMSCTATASDGESYRVTFEITDAKMIMLRDIELTG